MSQGTERRVSMGDQYARFDFRTWLYTEVQNRIGTLEISLKYDRESGYWHASRDQYRASSPDPAVAVDAIMSMIYQQVTK